MHKLFMKKKQQTLLVNKNVTNDYVKSYTCKTLVTCSILSSSMDINGSKIFYYFKGGQ